MRKISIKAMRKRARLTQQELAEKLNANQATVSMWERGKNAPRARQLPIIAEVLNCSIDELLREDDG